MKDAIPNLFAHWISLDIIAYLRLVSGTGTQGRTGFAL